MTQTSPSEQDALTRYADGKRRLVEIGVFEGSNTRRLADAMSTDGELFAIDPFTRNRFGFSWEYLIARAEARRSHNQAIHFVSAFSYEAAARILGDFDFVFIDGDHSLEGITRDWMDWASRVVPNGIMALHDSRPRASSPEIAGLGSCRYFESHIRHDDRFEIVEQVDALSVLRRR